MAKKKLASFRFPAEFIKESKVKAKSRNETFTDYIIYCVEYFNNKVSKSKPKDR